MDYIADSLCVVSGDHTQPICSIESPLIAEGFKVIVPKTATQQQKLQALPIDKVTLVQKDGKTYYAFPDLAHNQAYVGSPKQYQTYKQLRLENKLANDMR